MSSQLNYKPLPDSIHISCSPIEGMGIFATEKIEQGTNLGMSHLKISDTILRTPLGGFINHSNDPNLVKVELLMSNHDDPKMKFDYKKWNLVTLRYIKKGEELTLRYTFYNI